MRADLAQLNHLLARFNHGSPDPVSTRDQDTVTIFASYTPSPYHDLEIGKPGPHQLLEAWIKDSNTSADRSDRKASLHIPG